MPLKKEMLSFRSIILVIIALLLLWVFVGRYIGQKGKVRKQLDRAVAAIEAEDLVEFMDIFAMDYQDDLGFNYFMVKKFAQNAFNTYEDVDVDISKVRIEIDGNVAKVTLTIWGQATVASTMGKGGVPEVPSFTQEGAQLELRRAGGSWKFVSSHKIAWTATKMY